MALQQVSMVTDRAPTGINGLDDMIEGGFPRGSVVFNSESAPTTFRISPEAHVSDPNAFGFFHVVKVRVVGKYSCLVDDGC